MTMADRLGATLHPLHARALRMIMLELLMNTGGSMLERARLADPRELVMKVLNFAVSRPEIERDGIIGGIVTEK